MRILRAHICAVENYCSQHARWADEHFAFASTRGHESAEKLYRNHIKSRKSHKIMADSLLDMGATENVDAETAETFNEEDLLGEEDEENSQKTNADLSEF